MATQHTADAYDKYRQTIQPGQRALSRTKWSAQNAAPAAPATPTVLPDSTAPEGFNYGETLKNVAQEASKLNQQKQLDQRFEALGLGNLKGSQIDASFMGKLISGFKDAKDRGVLQHLGYEERKREAEQEAKTAATETAYKHFEDLGPILADVEPSKLQSMIAGSNIDYKTALLYQKKAEYDKKLSETKNEEEKIQLAKEMELMDLEIANAKKDLSGELTPKEQADLDYKLAQTDALLKETDDIYPNTADKSLTGVRPREDGGFNFGNPIAGRVECGMYRNDALGIIGSTGRMGDTFESKYKFASGKKPIEGGSFSMDYGQSGHCGLVEKVFPLAEGQIYPDILVADTNRGDKKDGVKKIDIIRPNDNGIYILPGTNNTPIAGFGKGIEPAKAATGDTSKPGQTHKDMAAKIGLTLPATQGEYTALDHAATLYDPLDEDERPMFNSGVIQYLADTSSLFTEEGTFDEAVADLNTFAEMLGGLNNIQPKEIIDSLNGNTEENKDSSVEENQTSSGDISFYFFDRGVDKNSAENFANFLKTAGYTDNEISETFDGMDIWWDKNDKFKDQFGADFQFKYVDGEVVA